MRITGGGNVQVTGTLSKGGGSFKIDHPLDPENKYLYHSFVESPDMMNIYNGTVVLDGKGEAVVTMPEWFEALNREFRYQLTAVGAPGPDLYIAEEIAGNSFKIAGGKAALKVSWQVTGVRKDPFAEKHRICVEEPKPESERGKYLHPEVYGKPREKGIGYLATPQPIEAASR
jgi:trimeric autotransporter adhesin